MTTDNDTYNGWANRETWALNLWLSNDEGLYNLTRERVAEAVTEHMGDTYFPAHGTADEQSRYSARVAGEAVQNLWDEITDLHESPMLADDILRMVAEVGSAWRVDWDEIGAAWLTDVTENPVSE